MHTVEQRVVQQKRDRGIHGIHGIHVDGGGVDGNVDYPDDPVPVALLDTCFILQ